MGATISATDAALLGLLTRGELSGYDLQRAAEANGGLFWAPAKSRIYAVLPQLVARGFLKPVDHPSFGPIHFPIGALASLHGAGLAFAPRLGEHNAAILTELGRTAGDLP